MSTQADRGLSSNAQFATTHWSLVLEAGHRSSPGSEQALADLCSSYWYPLYAFLRRRGHAAADAQDLTQEFFARLLEKDFLSVADPTRGRFRAFLLTVFKRFLANERDRAHAQKRGGDIQHLSIDFDGAEQRYQFEPTDGWTPEMIYERRWALTLLDQVLLRLESEYATDEQTRLFVLAKPCLTGAAPDYEEMAVTLGMTEGAIRVALHRMRKRYRALLKAAVAETLDGDDATEDELEYLRRAIRGEAT